MRPDQYRLIIEKVLSEIPNLEREIDESSCPDDQKRLEKTLKLHKKRFEHMISYKYRLALKNLCKEVGVKGDFM